MRRRIVVEPPAIGAREPSFPGIRRAAKDAKHFVLCLFLVMLVALVSACASSRQNHMAVGAGAGAAVGAVAGPAVVGGVLVGAAAGGVTGLAVYEARASDPNEPRAVVLRQLLSQQARLWNLTDPMLTASTEVCHNRTRPNFGFVAWTRWDIDPRYRVASMKAYGLDDRLRVVHVLPGSPAAAAGLQAGDEIEKVAHHDMPVGTTAGPALGLVLQREAVSGKAQTFRIRRDEERQTIEIVPRAQCDVDLIVTDSDRVNAVNHDRSIYVTAGLMRHFSDDQELAAVIAHFVGHALLEHEDDDESLSAKLEPQDATLRRAVLDETQRFELKTAGILPGDRPHSAMDEIQADRAALELLARAGYSMEALVEVWRRLAEKDNGALPLAEFHPPSPERQAATEDILTQVRGLTGAVPAEPDS